jgi:chitin synthase
LIDDKLKPVSQKFILDQIKDIHKSLQSLRNMTLAILLLINMMWMVLLASLTFWQLEQYRVDPRAFQLMFLAVYSFIILIQFFAMLAHRLVTLVHNFGRVKPREVTSK